MRWSVSWRTFAAASKKCKARPNVLLASLVSVGVTTISPAFATLGKGGRVSAARMDSANEGTRVHDKAERANTAAESATDPAPNWEHVVTRLVSERGHALERYAFLLCGNAEDAADLVQDALVKTFGRLRNGFTVSSAEAYVRKAVLNTYLDRGRRRSRWRRIAHLEVVPESFESETPTTDLRLDVHHRLRELSPRERACVVLRYFQDLKVDDIAAELGISAGAVKRYLSDALAKLAVSLDDGDDSGGGDNGAF